MLLNIVKLNLIKYRIWYFKEGLWNFLIYSACGIESSVLESFPKNILFGTDM